MGEALHPRRVEILRYLAWRASLEGPPPSVREIGAAVGLSSSQTVHHHLGRLEEVGYVKRVGRGARTLGLTGKGWEAAGHMAKDSVKEIPAFFFAFSSLKRVFFSVWSGQAG